MVQAARAYDSTLTVNTLLVHKTGQVLTTPQPN